MRGHALGAGDEVDQHDPGFAHGLECLVDGSLVNRRDEDRIRFRGDRRMDLRSLLIDIVGLVLNEALQVAAEAFGEPPRADLRTDIGRIRSVLGEAAKLVPFRHPFPFVPDRGRAQRPR